MKPPVRGQRDIFDAGFPGLALRVSYGGGKSFVLFYRVGGKLRRLTLGSLCSGEDDAKPEIGKPLTLKGARQIWRETRDDIQAGRDPAKSRNRGNRATDFKSVSDDWLLRDQTGNKSKKEVERVINREIMPSWEHRDVRSITKRDVIELIEAIADRGTPIMARRTLAYIHRFFKWASGRDIGVENNPAAGVDKPGQETKRDRVLTDKELKAVWKAADKIGWPFGPAIQLLILTGARRQEIGGLRWSEIQDAHFRLEGDRTKNGQPHDIPLSNQALSIIEKLRRIAGTDLVFPTNRNKPISGWSQAKIALDATVNISAWTVHDIRRTVATGLQRLGTSLQTTETVLGHISGSRAGVIGIYQRHSFADEAKAALEFWGAHVASLVGDLKMIPSGYLTLPEALKIFVRASTTTTS